MPLELQTPLRCIASPSHCYFMHKLLSSKKKRYYVLKLQRPNKAAGSKRKLHMRGWELSQTLEPSCCWSELRREEQPANLEPTQENTLAEHVGAGAEAQDGGEDVDGDADECGGGDAKYWIMSYKTSIWFTGSRAILESDALTPLCSVAHTSEGAKASGYSRPFLIDNICICSWSCFSYSMPYSQVWRPCLSCSSWLWG